MVSPYNRYTGIDQAVQKICFLMTTTQQNRLDSLRQCLNNSFTYCSLLEDSLFENFPFLREYVLGTFEVVLLECQANIVLATALNELGIYELYFESFRKKMVFPVRKRST